VVGETSFPLDEGPASRFEGVCPEAGNPPKDGFEGGRGEVESILDLEMGIPLGTTVEPPVLATGFLPLDTGRRLVGADAEMP
jgi:hypothetical protein